MLCSPHPWRFGVFFAIVFVVSFLVVLKLFFCPRGFVPRGKLFFVPRLNRFVSSRFLFRFEALL